MFSQMLLKVNIYLFNNTTGSYTLTFGNTGHAANGVAVSQGTKSIVYTTGSAMADVMADLGDINVSGIGNARFIKLLYITSF
jgi:hypothetical protein